MENGDSNSQSAGFELLRRSCAGRCRRPWSPPCRARHKAAPEKGPGGSTFRASGGTGLLLNASLQRAWTDGLLTERRRCSLTRRSERQAELETCGPPLKSARGERCTRGFRRADRPDAPGAGPTPRALPGSAQLPPPPFLGADLRSAPVRRARPDLLPDRPGGPGARGVLLTRRLRRDRAGGRR